MVRFYCRVGRCGCYICSVIINLLAVDTMKSDYLRAIQLPLNSNFLYSVPVLELCGRGRMDALVLYLFLLTHIRRNGCYVEIGSSDLVDEYVGLSGRTWEEVYEDIELLVEVGFFDKEVYDKHCVLTSRRLQCGYRRRKYAVPIPEEYLVKSNAERRRAESASKAVRKAEEAEKKAAVPAEGVCMAPDVKETDMEKETMRPAGTHRLQEEECRGDRIRTCDHLVPNQVRYRTALRPDCPKAMQR